ncbi:MAG: hypothetical protein AB7I52_19450 [Rhizobiaceae bacterium]
MLRFLLRLIGMVLLAAAVILAVVDATRTIASGALVLTPLADSWQAVSPQTFSALRALVEGGVGEQAWSVLADFVLALPGLAIFAVLSLIFFFVGRRPERKLGRFAIEG